MRPRVFCASLADVFEGRPDLDPWRADLWTLIEQCTELDWLLLTKRPENVLKMVPPKWTVDGGPGSCLGWPSHVWLGTSVENQAMADDRIPHLLQVPAPVRFLSLEPLLGPVDLVLAQERQETLFGPQTVGANVLAGRVETRFQDGSKYLDKAIDERRIHWVIVGGESGPKARPMHPYWVRSLRDQCVAAGVPFFFKQWGAYMPAIKEEHWREERYAWPKFMGQYGGKSAREIDGRTWDEMPRRVA